MHLFFISSCPHFCCSLPSLNAFYYLPLYCFKSAHFVSLASISLSPTHHANIPSLHTPKSSSSLSGFETWLFFPCALRHRSFPLLIFYSQVPHQILVLSEVILRTPVMLRTELIFNKFSNQTLIKLSIMCSVIFPKFFLGFIQHNVFNWGAYMHVFDTSYPMP